MNEVSSDTPEVATLSSAAPRGSGGFAQYAVLRALGRMKKGFLSMQLPDGKVWHTGTPGDAVSAAIQVRDPVFFQKCLFYGDIGFGESYVDGDWDTDSVERVIRWAILNVGQSPGMTGSRVGSAFLNILKVSNRLMHVWRPNSLSMSRRNIAEHYDLGNDFYQLWLDPSMTYSSGLFQEPGQGLESAQEAKYEALCRKLQVSASDHVLEIGTGWGGFCVHAAKRHGCRVTTVTISEQQFAYAKERVRREGVQELVEVQLRDYRQVRGQYDKVVSIEMMEAIGDRFLETFFAKIQEVLCPRGMVGLQYITVPDRRYEELKRGVDWIQKHIFPGSLLLSVGRVNQALNRTGDLFLHHLEDLGASYAKTLHCWWERFEAQRGAVQALGFDGRFMRKWRYYLQYCEAAFAGRNISVVQAIYTRPNNVLLHREF